MKQLIVTADDFGLARSINEGIAMALGEGIVTSVGLLPAGEAFDDAVKLAKELKIGEAGAHLALTEVRDDLPRHHADLFINIALNKINPDGIYSLLKAQLEAAVATGIKITNLSSHEHVHMAPAILKIFIRLAKEYGIPSIRYPRGDRMPGVFESRAVYRSLILASFSGPMKKALDSSGILYPDRFLGFLDSGNLTEEILLRMISSLKEGTTELVSHPGFLGPEVLKRYRFHINCERELFGLTSRRVKKAIDSNGIELVKCVEV